MAYYIKTRAIVAEKLGLTGQRLKAPDGSYHLWQADMAAIAPIWQLDETCAKIGARKLTAYESMLELQGQASYDLPEPTDPEWAEAEAEPAGESAGAVAEAETESDAEEEPQAEAEAETEEETQEQAGEGETE